MKEIRETVLQYELFLLAGAIIFLQNNQGPPILEKSLGKLSAVHQLHKYIQKCCSQKPCLVYKVYKYIKLHVGTWSSLSLLIYCFGFFAVSAIFQPCNGGDY